MNKTWITSDLHFNHKNIINLCNRPFDTIEEMNQTLIENWNDNIKKTDNVIFLGDFCFGKNEQVEYFCSKLNGNKLFILGNHDSKSPSVYRRLGFQEVSKYPIIYKDFYILSHAPVFINEKMPYVNVHGHTHQMSPELINNGKNMYYNACVDMNNFKPILFEDIIKNYR